MAEPTITTDAADMPASLGTVWEIVPQGFFSRHFDLLLDGEFVVTLQMAFFTEACAFEIAGHEFSIDRKSLWKDQFTMACDGQVCGEAKGAFWSRSYDISAGGDAWKLQPLNWLGRSHQLLAGEHEVGTIRPLGWLTRRREARFVESVPTPVQVLAIFLVLITSRREQQAASS